MAADDATFVEAVGTFQITSCYYNTSSCNHVHYGPSTIFGYPADDNSAVVTYLEVDQLNPNGSVCQTHRGYTEQYRDGETFDINKYVHHYPLYFDVSAPVSQTCQGSRQFRLEWHVQWEGGNPIKLDDSGNAYVLNSVRAKTTTVPSVTGDTVAQADAAIQAAGLTVTPPVNVIALAAKGIVVGENAPAGTVEPTGSPVQIMVSLGPTNADHGVTRPDDRPERAW
ncbi:MAG: PASTA domain-containing protein, partial [Ktedonobacterales bacterium]